MEILFVLLYACLIGFYNVFKKISLKKSSESTILVMFTTVAFVISLFWIPFGVVISWEFILIFALKGFLLSCSWFLILKVLKTADLSLVVITNITSAVLSFVLGIVIFNETAGIWQIIGSIIVVLGVAGINLINRKSKNKITIFQFVMLFISAIITTCSNIIDKYTTTYLTAYQTQFWFLFFVMIFSWIFFAVECFKKKEFLIKKHDLKNYWIYFVALFLVVGDFMLFSAYKVPGSKMITISILSKLKIVVAVFAGTFIFKEKNIWKKIVLSLFVVLGAIFISIF